MNSVHQMTSYSSSKMASWSKIVAAFNHLFNIVIVYLFTIYIQCLSVKCKTSLVHKHMLIIFYILQKDGGFKMSIFYTKIMGDSILQ